MIEITPTTIPIIKTDKINNHKINQLNIFNNKNHPIKLIKLIIVEIIKLLIEVNIIIRLII